MDAVVLVVLVITFLSPTIVSMLWWGGRLSDRATTVLLLSGPPSQVLLIGLLIHASLATITALMTPVLVIIALSYGRMARFIRETRSQQGPPTKPPTG